MSRLTPILVFVAAYGVTRAIGWLLDRLLGPLIAYVDDDGQVHYEHRRQS